MKRISRYFLQGLIFVTPIAVTILIFAKIFILIDEPVGNLVTKVVGRDLPGVGFLAAIVLGTFVLTVIGFLCTNFLTGRLMKFVERQFARFPLVKLLHSSIKDLMGAFVGDKKKFDKPVFVTLVPGSDVRAVGFVTRKSMVAWGMAEYTSVYLPQSYNFAGNLIVVPTERIQPIDLPSGDVMKFVVSGGVSGPDDAHTKPLEAASDSPSAAERC
jgi:uncharacterized membrane protein